MAEIDYDKLLGAANIDTYYVNERNLVKCRDGSGRLVLKETFTNVLMAHDREVRLSNVYRAALERILNTHDVTAEVLYEIANEALAARPR